MSYQDEIRIRERLKMIANMGMETPPYAPSSETLPDPTPTTALKAIGSQDLKNPDEDKDEDYFKPETAAARRYEDLLNQYPQEKPPSFARALIAGGLGIGRKGSLENQQKWLNEPHEADVSDWKNRADAAYKDAQLENNLNVNNRYIAGNMISARTAAERAASAERITAATNASREKIAKDKNDLDWAIANGDQVDFSGEYAMVHKKDGTLYNSWIPTTAFNPMERARLEAQSRENVARIGAAGRVQAAEVTSAAGRTFNAPADPNDPTSTGGAVQVGPGGTATPVTQGGKQLPALSKPSALVQPKNPADLKAIQMKTTETLQALDELLDKDGDLTPRASASIGVPHVLGMDYLPLTDAYAGRQSLKRLKSMLILEVIGEMKNQSRTGATGFGQLSIPEMLVLENAAGKLDPSQDQQTFKDELNRIREKLKKVLLPPDGMNPTVVPAPRTKLQQDIDKALGR